MTAWYYSDPQRNRLGPVAAADLAALHAGGQLQPGTLVWREGLADWRPWRELMDEVLGVGTAAPSAALGVETGAAAPAFAPVQEPALAASSGYNPYEVVERVPASPYAAPRAAVGGIAAPVYDGEVVYAGFWKRYAAYFIDALIVGIGGAIVGGIGGAIIGGMLAVGGGRSPGAAVAVQVVVQLLSFAIGAAYYAGFHASTAQATPGKQLVGIKVVRTDGTPISLARGIGRYFATILSSITLMIGWIMAGFTERKQALHDIVCDTLVVDRWAFTAQPENQRHELGTVTVVIIVISAVVVVGAIVMFGALAAVLANMAGSH